MDFNKILQEGIALLKNDELEQAIAKFDEILNNDSKNEEALLNKGIALYEDDKFVDAINIYDKLIEINNVNSKAYFNKANACAMLENYKDSIMFFTKAIEIDPEFFQAYINRGLDFLKIKNIQKAGDDFNFVINSGYKDKIAFYNMGIVFNLIGEHKAALVMYNRAIEVDPNYIGAYIKRGETLLDLGEKETAEQEFKSVLEKSNNKNMFAKLGLARVAYRNKNIEEALNILNEVEQSAIVRLDAILLKGIIFQNTGKLQEAFEAYSKVLNEDPTNVLANLNFARLMRNLKNNNRAIYHYTEVIKEQAGVIDAYFERGLIFFELKQYIKALEDFDKYLEAKPGDVKVLERKGKCLALTGRADEAKKLYRNLMEDDKENLHWIHCYGWTAMVNRDFDEALEYYGKAIEKQPDYVPAIADMSLIYAQTGRLEEAEEGFKRTLELDGKRNENHYNFGNFYIQNKRYDEAIKIFKAFTENNPEIGRGWFLYGNTLKANKQYEESLECFDKALGLEPKVIDSYMAKAESLGLLDRVEEANDLYEQLVNIYPKSVDILLFKGRFLIGTKQFESAIETLDKAILMNDKNPVGYNLRGVAYEMLGETEKAENDKKSFEELTKK